MLDREATRQGMEDLAIASKDLGEGDRADVGAVGAHRRTSRW